MERTGPAGSFEGPLIESSVSAIVGKIHERPDDGAQILTKDPHMRLRAAAGTGFPAVFNVAEAEKETVDPAGAQSVFRQRLLAARSKRQDQGAVAPPRASATSTSVWLADAGAAVGLEPTDVAVVDADNELRVQGMSGEERNDAWQEVRGMLGDSLLQKWAARNASLSASAPPGGAPSCPAPVPVAPTSRESRVLDLSGIRTEEELDEAAARLLPASERAKLAWTGMFDAAGLPALPEPSLSSNASNSDSYVWTVDDCVDNGGEGMASGAALRSTAAAGTAQLFSAWSRAAQSALAAEEKAEQEEEEDQDLHRQEGAGATGEARSVKVPPPEPLTTDTAASQWASIHETLGLSGPADIGTGVRLRVHPSGRTLRFDLDGRLVRPGWAAGAGLTETVAAAIALAAGLHHHGEDHSSAGYCLIEMLGLSRSSVPGQRVLACRMIGGVLDTRRAAFTEGAPPGAAEGGGVSVEDDRSRPWRYPPSEWHAESAAVRTLLIPPALPALLQAALVDANGHVARAALAALRAFAIGLPYAVPAIPLQSHLPPPCPTIRVQPPVEDEGDAGRLSDRHAPHSVVRAILHGTRKGGARTEASAVQSLRMGRAALVDPLPCLAAWGLLDRLAALVQVQLEAHSDTEVLTPRHLSSVMDILRLLQGCAHRSLSLSTSIARVCKVGVLSRGTGGARVRVGLLPCLASALLFHNAQALRSGQAHPDAVLAAVLTVDLVVAVCESGRGLAEELCDEGVNGGTGGGMGEGAPSGSGLPVAPLTLDALLQFAPVEASLTPPSLQLAVLRLLCCLTGYGLALDRVATMWQPHLVSVLQSDAEGAWAEALQAQVITLVTRIAGAAAACAPLAAASRLVDEGGMDAPASALHARRVGDEQAADNARVLCQQAYTMACAVLSSPAISSCALQLSPRHDYTCVALMEAQAAGMRLLASYFSVAKSGLLAGPSVSAPAPPLATSKLPVLEDMLIHAGQTEAATIAVVSEWILSPVRNGTWAAVASACSHFTGQYPAVAWMSAWCRLACAMHALKPDSINPLLQTVCMPQNAKVHALLLPLASAIGAHAAVVQDEAHGHAMDPSWWASCDPGSTSAVSLANAAYAGAAAICLHVRLLGPTSLAVQPAGAILRMLQPGDEAMALQLTAGILLHPACMVETTAGRHMDRSSALSVRAGLLPVWTSLICRTPLQGFTASAGSAATEPRPARLSAAKLHTLLPGLGVTSSVLLANTHTYGLEGYAVRIQDGTAPKEEVEEEGGPSIADLCLALPRPLRISAGLPCSAPDMMAAAVCCPLLLTGTLDKLRSSSAASVSSPDGPEDTHLFIRPLRDAILLVDGMGVENVLGCATIYAVPWLAPVAQDQARHAARTAVSSALLIFTLMHAPLIELPSPSGTALVRCILDAYAVFRTATPSASLIDVLVGHPAIGVGVLHALARVLVEIVEADGPGVSEGASELALLLLLLPQGAVCGEQGGQGTAYVRTGVWRCLVDCGIGHLVGTGLRGVSDMCSTLSQRAGLATLRVDLFKASSPSQDEAENEVECMAAVLTSEAAGRAAAAGVLVLASVCVEDEGISRAAAVGHVWPVESHDIDAGRDGDVPNACALAVSGLARALWGNHASANSARVWSRARLGTAHPSVQRALLTHVVEY